MQIFFKEKKTNRFLEFQNFQNCVRISCEFIENLRQHLIHDSRQTIKFRRIDVNTSENTRQTKY